LHVEAKRNRSEVRRGDAATIGEESIVKIGIIGAGNIGGNLTRRFAGLGHEV
jgi:phosphoglycerate dehydrogenase-like enzyme